ncbi:MAG: galactose mutarotase [Oscillospiraceae bacterium]|jgi:aldose 1-epimerase|nr:galactose mutarotase [Oscillospiraceae bacterium]
MAIQTEFYGPYAAYLLQNGPLRARVTAYGATLLSLWAPDRQGREVDVLLGFDTPEAQHAYSDYQGETVGRCANRIAGARFSLNGQEYHVTANEKGTTCLHGGGEFSHAVWDAEIQGDNAVEFRCISPAGSEGFPGEVRAAARYVLEPGRLRMEYRAESDTDTILNLTNHAYFNLAGGGDVLRHELQINAAAYLPIDEQSIPTGERRPVAGTAFDFRRAKPIGRDIRAEDPQLAQCRGYDHNFCLTESDRFDLTVPAAAVSEPGSGRRLTVYTDQPGIQLYTGNFLDGKPGKGGVPMEQHSGFCLETQVWPDSPNHPDFPSCLLMAGEVYQRTTILQLDA